MCLRTEKRDGLWLYENKNRSGCFCAFYNAGVLGFEPRITGPEPVALPLGYTPRIFVKKKEGREHPSHRVAKNFEKIKAKWKIGLYLHIPPDGEEAAQGANRNTEREKHKKDGDNISGKGAHETGALDEALRKRIDLLKDNIEIEKDD